MPTEITNKHNLPQPIVDAVTYNTHVKNGQFSITELFNPPQIRQLKKKFTIKEDAIDRVWALFGTAVHNIIERSSVSDKRHIHADSILGFLQSLINQDVERVRISNLIKEIKSVCDQYLPPVSTKYMVEKNLTVDLEGVRISGTIDLYDSETGEINDYKVCSAWNHVFQTEKTEWLAQQNAYAFLLRENGYKVSKANIVAIYRDWSKNKMYQSPDYPRNQVGIIPMKLYDHELVKKSLVQRIRIHKRAEEGEDIKCNGKEKWENATTYALKRKTAKRALRVYDTLEKAQNALEKKNEEKDKFFIETRPGERMRCNFYCPVKDVCPQKAKENK